MSDEDAFLSAISADPEDDTARLVYADWLQERNDPRADYLRLEVRRHRMTPRERRKEDPFHQLEKLRTHATPDWLSRIDRVNRFCISWLPAQCEQARAEGLVGRPLALVQNRPLHQGWFPRTARAGNYFYVITPYTGPLMVVGRTRLRCLCEVPDNGRRVMGFEGTEGTPVRLDLPVPPAVAARFTWYQGKRIATLPMSGTRLAAGALVRLALICRLTPCTAADLDAVLRGDSLS